MLSLNDRARELADQLAAGGAEIANDVVLNQVLVRFGDGALCLTGPVVGRYVTGAVPA